VKELRRADLALLGALHALLEERNVTRAAETLALTQPTVSAMLARLRKLFNDPLFVRAPRGLLPTPRAQALAPALKQWLADADALVAGQSFEPASALRTISIAANDYIQSTLLVPLLQRLRQEAPQMRVAVRPAQTDRIAELLADGELDLSLTGTTEITSFDLPSRTLYDERYVCAIRESHPLARVQTVTLDQFCSYPHLMVSPTEGRFAGPTDVALAQVGRTRRVVLSVPGFLTLPEVLQTDDLIAVVPERVLIGRSHALRTFMPPLQIPGFDVVALWHPRVHRDPALRWLRELLATTALELQTASAGSRSG